MQKEVLEFSFLKNTDLESVDKPCDIVVAGSAKNACDTKLTLWRGVIRLSDVPNELRSLLSTALPGVNPLEEDLLRAMVSVGQANSTCRTINGYVVVFTYPNHNFIVLVKEHTHLFERLYKPLREVCPKKKELIEG
jgi:hypothetical protein